MITRKPTPMGLVSTPKPLTLAPILGAPHPLRARQRAFSPHKPPALVATVRCRAIGFGLSCARLQHA